MNVQKLAGILGFATRARQTAAGNDACRILLRSGKCGVILMDADTGSNTRKKTEELCLRTGTPIITLPSGLIESATGKSNVIIAVKEGSFTDEILKTAEG
jgi:ribosomal protein L7Ae-like RNA K-turn-binding protein